jgi:hypothetical protein
VKGFPFSVVYREEQDEIIVFAIRADARARLLAGSGDVTDLRF